MGRLLGLGEAEGAARGHLGDEVLEDGLGLLTVEVGVVVDEYHQLLGY
jgi:hypothetical protein